MQYGARRGRFGSVKIRFKTDIILYYYYAVAIRIRIKRVCVYGPGRLMLCVKNCSYVRDDRLGLLPRENYTRIAERTVYGRMSTRGRPDKDFEILRGRGTVRWGCAIIYYYIVCEDDDDDDVSAVEYH